MKKINYLPFSKKRGMYSFEDLEEGDIITILFPVYQGTGGNPIIKVVVGLKRDNDNYLFLFNGREIEGSIKVLEVGASYKKKNGLLWYHADKDA